MAFQSHLFSSSYGVGSLHDLTARVRVRWTSPEAAVGSDPQHRCWDVKDSPLFPLLRKKGTPRSLGDTAAWTWPKRLYYGASETSFPGRLAPSDKDVRRPYSDRLTEE